MSTEANDDVLCHHGRVIRCPECAVECRAERAEAVETPEARDWAETLVDRASQGWGIHHGHYKALVDAVAKALSQLQADASAVRACAVPASAVEAWVSCEERMPEVHTTVLVVCRSRAYPDRLEPGFRLARLDDDGEWIEAGSLDEIRRVVRWLPIPESR